MCVVALARLNKTFARFVNRPGQTAELIGMSEVSCGYTYTTPECSSQVAGRFGDEPSVQLRLLSQFEREDAGNLFGVIVLWHKRQMHCAGVDRTRPDPFKAAFWRQT